MENLILKRTGQLIILLLSISHLTWAQVFNGDLILSSQSEVNSFNYAEVTGNLIIGQEQSFNTPLTDINNLSALSTLNSVGGNLSIQKTRLVNLSGLDQLTSVGSLTIVSNDFLVGLSNLSSLGPMAGDLIIAVNPDLQSLSGLEGITSVGGLMDIEGNARLMSLEGLKNLETIGEWVVIDENHILPNLDGLDKLRTVGDWMRIGPDHFQLQDIEALSDLETIGGSLTVTGNSKLVTLDGLHNLQSVDGLTIRGNPMLDDCCAIAGLLSLQTQDPIVENNGVNCNSTGNINLACGDQSPGFTLVDPHRNLDLRKLDPSVVPEIINVLETGNVFNIRADFDHQPASVVFELNGIPVRTENVFPYALFGNLPPWNYFHGMLSPGRYQVKAIPFTMRDGTGTNGDPMSIEILVVNKPLAITGFTMVSSDDNTDLFQLEEGMEIPLSQLPVSGVNIRAHSFGPVESVAFRLNSQHFRTENVDPYALGGDFPTGDYFPTPAVLQAGDYSIAAIPFTGNQATGEAGTPLTIRFKIIDDAWPSIELLVYPNPARGVLNIHRSNQPAANQAMVLSLYNSMGM